MIINAAELTTLCNEPIDLKQHCEQMDTLFKNYVQWWDVWGSMPETQIKQIEEEVIQLAYRRYKNTSPMNQSGPASGAKVQLKRARGLYHWFVQACRDKGGSEVTRECHQWVHEMGKIMRAKLVDAGQKPKKIGRGVSEAEEGGHELDSATAVLADVQL